MRSSNDCSSPVLPECKEARPETSTGEPPFILPFPAPVPSMPSSTHHHHHLRIPQRDLPAQSSDAVQTGAAFTAGLVLIPINLGIRTAKVRKPIIYLYPPTSLPDVNVELHLAPSWRFSAIYPPPQTLLQSGEHQTQTAQSLTWTIAAEPSGTLVHKTTGTEVSFLYWEAM
jgi:hypothetical protein